MNHHQNHHQTTTTTTTTTTKIKTRDLPNITECHSCGFRVDTCTNGKSNPNNLQTLYSEWRIVLLCKNCFSNVESSQICSYCFKDSTANTNVFRCFQCRRSIHKNCFSKHKNVAPWSYSCFHGEFTVCIDCWVPKRGAVTVNSRVLEIVAEEKAEVAVRAREIAVKKAVVARKAVELANKALDLVVVAKKKKKNNKRVKECDVDTELAFRLHRAINSSPRMISRKNWCTLNSTCLDIPKNNGEMLYAPRDRSVVSETITLVSTTNVDCLKPCRKVYLRKRKKCDGGDNEIAVVKWEMKEREESCSNKLLNSSVDDNSMNSESNGERCDGKPDRYLLKYRKRKSSSKGIIPNSESKSKFLCEGFLVECQASAAGLALNCSNESRTFSNAAFRPCSLSLQASASCDQS